MRLGELLVSEKLVTAEGLEEALESQVVHGGRLGTNLLELGLLQEADLARSLGRLHQVPFASGEMQADPNALKLVDPNFADDKDLLPMRLDATKLTVVMINPRDLETLDSVAFKVGRRVVPVVIPEFRMNQLLRRYCKAFRPMRAIDMNVVRPSRTLAGKEEKEAAPADLMSDEEFQNLYAKALSGGASAAVEVEEELPSAEIVVEPTPVGPPPQLPPLAVAPGLEFADAQKLLQASNDREDIARTLLRFAVSKWKRALLLSVQGSLVTGWHGVGQGLRHQAVRRIGIALKGQSTFQLVCATRSHYIGPMKRDAGTAVFYKLLGGGFPTTAVLLPLLVRGKVVHLLYLDNGPDELTPPDVGELLILSQNVARSYEVLMKRRKDA
ncbi:MAG: hypothetical protein ACOZIN_12065 [Myxococcota bacterium]